MNKVEKEYGKFLTILSNKPSGLSYVLVNNQSPYNITLSIDGKHGKYVGSFHQDKLYTNNKHIQPLEMPTDMLIKRRFTLTCDLSQVSLSHTGNYTDSMVFKEKRNYDHIVRVNIESDNSSKLPIITSFTSSRVNKRSDI